MSLQTIRTKARNLNVKNPNDSEIAEMYCDVQNTINQDMKLWGFMFVMSVLVAIVIAVIVL